MPRQESRANSMPRVVAALVLTLSNVLDTASADTLGATCQITLGNLTFDMQGLKGGEWTVDGLADQDGAGGLDDEDGQLAFSACGRMAPITLPTGAEAWCKVTPVMQAVVFNEKKKTCTNIASKTPVSVVKHGGGVELMSSVVGTKGVYVFKIFLECDMEAGISLPIEVDQTAANTYEVMWPSSMGCATNGADALAYEALKKQATGKPAASISEAEDEMTTQVQDLAKLRSEGKLTDEEMEEDSQKLSDEIDLMREEMLGEEEQIKTDKEAKEGSLFHKSMSWFLILLSTYFVLGTLFNAFVKDQRGLRAVPHFEFLATLPVTCKDKCRGCTKEGAWRGGYESVPMMAET